MNREDKDVFDFMNRLSEEDSIKLLEGIDFDEEELSDEKANRIKSGVIAKLDTRPRKRNYKKSFIAAAVAALLVFTGFTPSGQKAVAEIIKKLYFIPGIGRVQETGGRELYVLAEPVKSNFNGGEIVIKSAVRDKNFLSIGLEGDKNIEVEDFMSIMITDENGKSYNKPGYSLGRSSSIWNGSLGFKNVPEDMNSFNIVLPDKRNIHITLSLAESFEDFKAMGPTDIRNNLGITLVPSKAEKKVKFNLVQHPMENRRVEEYGKQVDLDNYGKYDITVKDDLGRQYELDYPKQYSSPLSEFYFEQKEDAKSYIVEIPEVSLTYKAAKTIKFPIPKQGELKLNKNFEINGFIFTVKNIVRTDNLIKVYVDTNFDPVKSENLSWLKIEAINSERSIGYSWNVNRDNRTVEYFEFEVKPKDENVNLRFSEFNTILEGPWTFQFPAQ